MAVTSKGRSWERRHLIWMVWAYLASPWISFFYIGIRAKHRRWIVWGAVYSVPFILSMFTAESPENSAGSSLTGFLLVVAWIGGIIHAFRVRKEYLLRLEARQQRGKIDTDAALRQRIQTEYGSGAQGPASSPVASQASTTGPKPERPAAPSRPTPSPPSPSAVPQRSGVDLNNASEQDIASLPGVGVIVAKRAVGLRESRGGFHTLEDFGQALNLKPHVVERLRPLVSVSPPQQFGRSDSSGRVVDF